jgi:hypothetical protein
VGAEVVGETVSSRKGRSNCGSITTASCEEGLNDDGDREIISEGPGDSDGSNVGWKVGKIVDSSKSGLDGWEVISFAFCEGCCVGGCEACFDVGVVHTT